MITEMNEAFLLVSCSYSCYTHIVFLCMYFYYIYLYGLHQYLF